MKLFLTISFLCSALIAGASESVSKYAVMEAEKYNYTAYDADDTAWYGGGLKNIIILPTTLTIQPGTEEESIFQKIVIFRTSLL